MTSPGDAFLIAALTVGIAGAIGYGAFRLISPKDNAETPAQLGRKWFAWVALIVTITLLPKFIRTFDINPFAIWLVNFVTWGGIAFTAGWLYGKVIGLRGLAPATESSSPSPGIPFRLDHDAAQKLPAQKPVASLSTNFPRIVPPDNYVAAPLQVVVDEERIYAEIARELETAVEDKGLWTRLFADCGGDEKQTKVLYIKQRAERLMAAERARLEQVAREQATQRVIEECSRTLSGLGYRLSSNAGGWDIKEPLGGRVRIRSLEDLIEYATSKQTQARPV